MMTKREKEIVDILRKDPMISQNDLSAKLGISRSSAAVHITNLMKKGIVLGKGYVINEEDFTAVLGGANIDIMGFPTEGFTSSDSNPGVVHQSVGGVGRNIAENLARLSVSVRFLSMVGDDMNGRMILQKTGEAGVDVSHVIKVKAHATGVYMSIQDESGDMVNAISQMSIYDTMDESYPESVLKVLESSSKVVLDTNLSERALNYLGYKLSRKDVYLDTVSVKKALRARHILSNIHTIKPNMLEAEALTGIKITDETTLRRNGDWFLEKGVKNIYISLGKDGLYARNDEREGLITAGEIHAENATGSGDAMMAGIIMESGSDNDIELTAKTGMAASLIALMTQDTINRNLNPESIRDVMKEYEIKWKDI